VPSCYVVVANQGGALGSDGDDATGSPSFLLPSFPSFLFSSPLSLAVWAMIVPLGWQWNGWRWLRLWLRVLIAEHGHGWVVNGGEAWRSTWRAVMCAALGLGRSGAAGDRIGEGNFAFHAVGEGTVVAGGGYGHGQGNSVTVCVGSSWVMASVGRRRGALVGLGAGAWSARLGFGDRENLFLAVSMTLSPPSHNGQNRGLGKRKEDDGFARPVRQRARSEGCDAL
jgi:hypothetical protein